jgi:hypothetical protein
LGDDVQLSKRVLRMEEGKGVRIGRCANVHGEEEEEKSKTKSQVEALLSVYNFSAVARNNASCA